MIHRSRASICRSSLGFTLIELLVTMVIIAVLVGAVVLNIEFRNVGKIIHDTSLRTSLLMQLASDQAVYSRQQFGIRFFPQSYQFFILATDEDDEESWELFEDEQLRFQPPAADLEYEVQISGVPIVLGDMLEELADATDENPLKPHIIFLSNGEIMPDFRILIRDVEGEYEYEVATGDDLPIVIEQLASP